MIANFVYLFYFLLFKGVPVYNNSGRYWVKFYHMGKEKKIEVDDKLPVNKNGKCKLPRSINLEE